MPELHCLGTSFDREVDHEGALTLFIPYDLFASTAGLHRMLDVKFEGGLGRLLADYLFLLDRPWPICSHRRYRTSSRRHAALWPDVSLPLRTA